MVVELERTEVCQKCSQETGPGLSLTSEGNGAVRIGQVSLSQQHTHTHTQVLSWFVERNICMYINKYSLLKGI